MCGILESKGACFLYGCERPYTLLYGQASSVNALLVWLAANQQEPQQPPVVTACTSGSCSNPMGPIPAESTEQPITDSIEQPKQANPEPPYLPSTQDPAGPDVTKKASSYVAPDRTSAVGSTSTHAKVSYHHHLAVHLTLNSIDPSLTWRVPYAISYANALHKPLHAAGQSVLPRPVQGTW